MSDDKIMVKKIIEEFEFSANEILAVIKHLNIKSNVRSNTILTESEALRVREYIKEHGIELSEVKKESKVILRRNKKSDEKLVIDTKKEISVEEEIKEVKEVKEVIEEVSIPKKEEVKVSTPAPEEKPLKKPERPVVQKENEEKTTPQVRRPYQSEKPQVRVIARAEPRQWEPPTSTPSTSSYVKKENSQPNRRSEQEASTPKKEYTKPSYTPGKDRADARNAPSRPAPGKANSGARDFNTVFPATMESTSTQSKKKKNKNKKSTTFEKDGEKQGKNIKNFSLGEDDFQRRYKQKKQKAKNSDSSSVTQPIKAEKRKIRVDEVIRVSEIAHQLGIKATEIIKSLFNLGVMVTLNQVIDIETAILLASEFGYEVEAVGFSEEDALLPKIVDKEEDLLPRSPVVTIMGHVDHGKTSLLDAIRRTNVIDKEAGGITQHIGAYHVTTAKGNIVFLDTPGHEAFTAMRARGAEVTDIVVLVVAADDGVMEQTREAVNHAKAAGVPIMVAVNKMDKEGANPERVQRELAELGLTPEAWGGDTSYNLLSAKAGTGVEDLLEMIALQAEILSLKANPNKSARGRVIEAHLDKTKGASATILIQSGTLQQGDIFVCGSSSGRVRSLYSDYGKKLKEAGPSYPVEVHGFNSVPEAGEEFIVLEDERTARRIADIRTSKQRERTLAKDSKVTLETFLLTAGQEEELKLNLIVKADVQGSLEAILQSLTKLSTEKVSIRIIHSGTGAISESDILLAATSSAIVIGFNIRPIAKIKHLADQENVDVRFYNIIYKLSEDIKKAMQGLLTPISKEIYLGQAEVRQIFSIPKQGTVAGAFVVDGKFVRNTEVRLLREGVVIYTGKISSLKRFKDDVKEVMKGYECGFMLTDFNDIKVGDIVEAFAYKEEAAIL